MRSSPGGLNPKGCRNLTTTRCRRLMRLSLGGRSHVQSDDLVSPMKFAGSRLLAAHVWRPLLPPKPPPPGHRHQFSGGGRHHSRHRDLWEPHRGDSSGSACLRIERVWECMRLKISAKNQIAHLCQVTRMVFNFFKSRH